LSFSIPTLGASEGDGSHLLDRQRCTVLKVVGKLVRERVDVFNGIASGERTHAGKLLAIRSREAVEDLLGLRSGIGIPGGFAELGYGTIALSRRERVLKSFERCVDMKRRVPTLLHGERELAYAARCHPGGVASLGGVRAACLL